jgi:hypothetical protein
MQLGRLLTTIPKSPRMVEQKFAPTVTCKAGRTVMNKSYFDVILVSLIVAGCYLFIAPV